MLFLHKLGSIKVDDSIANKSVHIEKSDRNDGKARVVSLTTTTTTTTDGEQTSDEVKQKKTITTKVVKATNWLVAKKQLPLSELPATYVTRPADQVRFTELSLAFPLDDDNNDGDSDDDGVGKNRSLPVFAFLPLRSYGFDFVIQGEPLLDNFSEVLYFVNYSFLV